MVKLDLEVKELVGLFIIGSISEKKLAKYIKDAKKDELEAYVLDAAMKKKKEESFEDEASEPEEEETDDKSDDDEEEEDKELEFDD